ncbi:MAG: hypothetical protein GY930_04275 [bacterium]|nr:hypothetical protein [bacterium]
MHRFLISTSCLVLLIACADSPSFSGNYGAQYMGQPVNMHLVELHGELDGRITFGQMSFPLKGEIEGDMASGQANTGVAGFAPFEARMDGDDSLLWKLQLASPGGNQVMALNFTRSKGDADSARSGDGPSNLDPKLVGRWRRTSSNSVAGTLPRNNMNVATDIFCTLAGDGSFSYGGAVTGVASTGFAGTTGSADGSTREWKAEGGVLFSRTIGQQWIQLGRYAISGSSLVLYAGNDKQLWERQ